LVEEEEADYETGGDGIHLKGVRGRGPPMHCNFNGKRKTFTDGFGLCSPGRWPPEARQDYYENPDLAFHHRLGTLLLDLLSKRVDIRGVAFLLASGKCASCPFSDELLQQGREIVFAQLKSVGCQLPVDCVAEGQPFYLCALEAILQQAGDPDALAFHSAENSFASGVRLGVNCVLPRVPAVFTAKTHWRNYDHITEQTELRENYITAQEHRDVVQKQFEKEASLGAMMEIGLEQAQKSGARFLLHLWGRWRKLTEATGLYMMQHTASLLIQRYGCRIKSEAPRLRMCVELYKRCLMPSSLSKEM
jgi:hypothetical protein